MKISWNFFSDFFFFFSTIEKEEGGLLEFLSTVTSAHAIMSGVQPTICAHLNDRNLFYDDGLKSCCKVLKHFGVYAYRGEGSIQGHNTIIRPVLTVTEASVQVFGLRKNQGKTISQNKRRNRGIIFFSFLIPHLDSRHRVSAVGLQGLTMSCPG